MVFTPGEKVGASVIVARLYTRPGFITFLARSEGERGALAYRVVESLDRGANDEPERRDAFLERSRLLATVRIDGHPTILEMGELHGIAWVAREFIDGITLDQLLTALGRKRRALSHTAAAHLGARLARTLVGVHEACGEWHGGIEADRVLVGFDGRISIVGWTNPYASSVQTESGDVRAVAARVFEAMTLRRADESVVRELAQGHGSLGRLARDGYSSSIASMSTWLARAEAIHASAPVSEADFVGLMLAVVDERAESERAALPPDVAAELRASRVASASRMEASTVALRPDAHIDFVPKSTVAPMPVALPTPAVVTTSKPVVRVGPPPAKVAAPPPAKVAAPPAKVAAPPAKVAAPPAKVAAPPAKVAAPPRAAPKTPASALKTTARLGSMPAPPNASLAAPPTDIATTETIPAPEPPRRSVPSIPPPLPPPRPSAPPPDLATTETIPAPNPAESVRSLGRTLPMPVQAPPESLGIPHPHLEPEVYAPTAVPEPPPPEPPPPEPKRVEPKPVEQGPADEPARRSALPFVGLAIVLIAAAVGGYLVYAHRSRGSAATSTSASTVAEVGAPSTASPRPALAVESPTSASALAPAVVDAGPTTAVDAGIAPAPATPAPTEVSSAAAEVHQRTRRSRTAPMASMESTASMQASTQSTSTMRRARLMTDF